MFQLKQIRAVVWYIPVLLHHTPAILSHIATSRDTQDTNKFLNTTLETQIQLQNVDIGRNVHKSPNKSYSFIVATTPYFYEWD